MNDETFEVVIAADPGTEVVISNSQRIKLAGGAGSQSASLAPGIYKARFKAGEASQDVLFEVVDKPVTLHAPPLRIASPLPLPGTSTSHEYQKAAVNSLPRMKLGQGGELAVLTRDSKKIFGEGESSEPWLGLSVQDMAGNVLADLAMVGLRDSVKGLGAVCLEVAPDNYLLTLSRKSSGSVQLPVTVSAGWRTCAYLDCRDGEDRSREPDIFNTSIIIMPLANAVNLDDRILMFSELAKQALIRGRASVDANALTSMIHEKFEYPMLGILAAHVLLLEEKPNIDILAVVIRNLDELVPGHPDLLALHFGLARHLPEHKFVAQLSGPPMLRNSWDILVAASVDNPGLMPADAAWLRHAGALCGTRLWLVWQGAAGQRAEGGLRSIESALEAIPGASFLRPFVKPALQYAASELFGARNPQELLENVIKRSKSVLGNEEQPLDHRILISIWSTVHEALKDPSIAQSPLQSTLRRKLLGLIEDAGSADDETDGETKLEPANLRSIASDLRVPVGVLLSAANDLFLAAAHAKLK